MAPLRHLLLGTMILAGLCLPPVALRADSHVMSQRLQLGASWKASPALTLRGIVQSRFHEGYGDYYFFLSDLGFDYHPAALKGLRLVTLYRYQDKRTATGWQTKHYLMLDPTLRLLRHGNWELDYRQRFQLNAAEGLGLVYLRPLLRVSRYFRLHQHPARAWVYYDYYLTVERGLRRAWADPSDLSTGVSLSLNPGCDLLMYYMIYSSRAKTASTWSRVHQPCLALSFRL